MFKRKKLICNVEDMEAINFCRVLGKYGLKFDISELRRVSKEEGDTRKQQHYRVFIVYTTEHKVDEIYDELKMYRMT